MNLGRRFAIGSLQLGAGQLVTNAANLVMQLAIARLLGPAEFGIYALAFAIHEFIAMIGSFSFGLALVQTPNATEEDYDTALTLLAGLGVAGLAIATTIGVLGVAGVSPRAAPIVVALALAQLPRLLWQVPEAWLARNLRFASVAVIVSLAAIVPNAFAVLLAWLGFGAWSLAIRDIATTLLLLGGGLWMSGYRFRGRVTREARTKLMAFGKPMFASRSIEIVLERLDNLAAGLFFGERGAGLYHQARFLADTGFIATRPIEQLSVNLYARVQDDPERRARAWYLLNTGLWRGMLAGAAVLLMTPEPLVRLLLGDAWLETATLLRWLALYAALLPLFQNAKNLCYGSGEVSRVVRVRLLQSGVFAVGIAAAVASEVLYGLAAALLLAVTLGLALMWRETRDLAPTPRLGEIARPLAALGAALLAFAGLERGGAFDAIAWGLHPLLPPILYAAFLALFEGKLLLLESRALLDHLRSAPDA